MVFHTASNIAGPDQRKLEWTFYDSNKKYVMINSNNNKDK